MYTAGAYFYCFPNIYNGIILCSWTNLYGCLKGDVDEYGVANGSGFIIRMIQKFMVIVDMKGIIVVK